jgi:inorganic triphosphatase YgiF
MDELLERESKWDVDEHFALPPLDDIGDVERETVGLTSTYYDTADGDLQSHGVLLRRRDGDDDTGWQLKVPDPDGRVEIRTGLSESPPPALANALLGMRLGKPLVTVATIRTTRDRYRITDPKDHRLCVEIDDDRVHASTEHRLLAWREIEVELGPAARSMPRLLADRLTESGARPSRHASKLAHVAAELRAPAAKAKRAKKSEKHYKRIQRVLGEHQDSVVASGTLRRLAITAGTTPGENGFTFGLLWAREQEAAEAARRRARELLG